MEEITEEITRESTTSLNIEELALNRDFGRLTFNAGLPFLKKTQELFKEFDELSYRDTLSPEEVSSIETKKDQFVQIIKNLKEFDIGQADSQVAHDNLEQEFTRFYNNTSRELRTQLVYLRQEVAKKSQNTEELAAQQKAAVQAEKEYKILSEKLKLELESLQEQKKKVETAHGEVASKVLAHHFAKQANDYTDRAGDNFYKDTKNSKDNKGRLQNLQLWINKPRSWRTIRSIFWWSLFVVIVFNFLSYFLIFFLNKFDVISLSTGNIFTPEYFIIKLALVSLLYYGMHFASRNYNVVSHLEAINRHRKNVAQTLEDFLATDKNEEVKAEILRQGIEAMFKHVPTGYIRNSTGDKDDTSSVIKSFTSIMKEIKK